MEMNVHATVFYPWINKLCIPPSKGCRHPGIAGIDMDILSFTLEKLSSILKKPVTGMFSLQKKILFYCSLVESRSLQNHTIVTTQTQYGMQCVQCMCPWGEGIEPRPAVYNLHRLKNSATTWRKFQK